MKISLWIHIKVFKNFFNFLDWTSILTFNFSWTHIQKWMWVVCPALIVTPNLLHSIGVRTLRTQKWKLYRGPVPQQCTTGATDELPIAHIKKTSIHLQNFYCHRFLYGCMTAAVKKISRCIKCIILLTALWQWCYLLLTMQEIL